MNRALPAGRAGRERGVASMLVVGLTAVLLMTTVIAVGMVQVVAARHAAAAAADLGALAGAAMSGGGDQCAAAAATVHSNGAETVSCQVAGGDVVVTAAVQSKALLGLRWTLRSTARAGPAR